MKWLPVASLLAEWLCSPAHASIQNDEGHRATPSVTTADQRNLEPKLAEVKLFLKKHWYDDAARELRQILQTPAGQQSYQAWWLATEVAWQVLDIDWAEQAADRAAELAPDDTARARAKALADSERREFGWLKVTAPYPGMVSRIQVELKSTLFDPELKRWVNRAARRLHERSPLPVRIGMPAGTYVVNGHEVTVSAGEEALLALPMSAIGAKGLAALQVTRLEVSPAATVMLGQRVSNLSPSFGIQASLSQPLGRLLVGAMVEAGPQRYLALDTSAGPASLTWAAGARIGTERFAASSLSVRPSVTVRYGQVPGIALDCVHAGSTWTCSAPTLTGAPLRVHAIGHSIAPGLELALDYRDAGRTTAVGTGVKLAVEHHFGTLPSRSVALLYQDPAIRFAWSTADTTWRATAFRMAANLSFAF